MDLGTSRRVHEYNIATAIETWNYDCGCLHIAVSRTAKLYSFDRKQEFVSKSHMGKCEMGWIIYFLINFALVTGRKRCVGNNLLTTQCPVDFGL